MTCFLRVPKMTMFFDGCFLAKCLSLAVIECRAPRFSSLVGLHAGRRRMVLGYIIQTPIRHSYNPNHNLTPVLETKPYLPPFLIAIEVSWTAVHAVR
jgi:hypothetical protein